MADVKEIIMDIGKGGSLEEEGTETTGDMQMTRRRRRRTTGTSRRGRRTAELSDVSGGVAVHKESAVIPPPPLSTPSVIINPPSVISSVAAALGAKPNIIIAPPKKKPVKVMLVPKKVGSPLAVRPQKTFKAKRVRVMIDNTAKTQKRRRLTLQEVDSLSEENLRLESVRARLSKPETVAKVPVELLRQMLKDYRMMRGMLL